MILILSQKIAMLQYRLCVRYDVMIRLTSRIVLSILNKKQNNNNVIMLQAMLPKRLMFAFNFFFQVLRSKQPLIVYFPDSSEWLCRAVPKSNRKEFVQKVQEMFDLLSGPVVLICGQNKVESGSKEKEKFVSFMHLMTIVKLSR